MAITPNAAVLPVGRGRDVRNAIKDALDATDAFAEVRLASAEEYTVPASDFAAATIEPGEGTEDDPWDVGDDVGLVVREKCLVTLLVRDNDYKARDEKAEQLLQVLKNAVNGRSLGGLTMPDLTRVRPWRWQKAAPPERRIAATVNYAYLQDGWDAADESE